MPDLGTFDHDRVVALEQLVNGRGQALQRRQSELQLGADGIAADRRGLDERHIFVRAVLGAVCGDGIEVEPLEVDEQLAQAIGVAAHTDTPCNSNIVPPNSTPRHKDSKGSAIAFLSVAFVSWCLCVGLCHSIAVSVKFPVSTAASCPTAALSIPEPISAGCSVPSHSWNEPCGLRSSSRTSCASMRPRAARSSSSDAVDCGAGALRCTALASSMSC